MSKELIRFAKNSSEEIHFEFTQFKGHDLVDIRVWGVDSENPNEQIPTKKGITFSVDLLDEFMISLGRLVDTRENP